MSEETTKDSIDDKFDKAEKIVDRSKSLLIKVVGSLVAVVLALFLGLDQLAGDEEEYDDSYDEVYEDVIDTTDLDTSYIDTMYYE